MIRNIITPNRIINIAQRYCHTHSKKNLCNYNCKYSLEHINQIKTLLVKIEDTMAYMYIVNICAFVVFYLK